MERVESKIEGILTTKGISRKDHLPQPGPSAKRRKVGNGEGGEQVEEDDGEDSVAEAEFEDGGGEGAERKGGNCQVCSEPHRESILSFLRGLFSHREQGGG